jgi:light-regulated signal transduction histidine kinase (bacteriophytochrome)
MKIKNLVPDHEVTITNCESEPIHIPGSIQPHGFLLAVKIVDYSIAFASKNCEIYFQLPLNEIIGKSLNLFFNAAEINAFTAQYQFDGSEMERPFVFSLQGKLYSTSAHNSGDTFILEMEPFAEEHNYLPELYIQTKRFAYHTERSDNLRNLCQDIANETKMITGYDRVMIYRFDKDYNGEVYAESKEDDLEPFLGLFYPHTDIPAQARDLYLRNHVRMIADVGYEPVPLFALEEEGGSATTLDLSLSFLRSVSPIHIQYLKNMGVAASFSISLIHNKKLWGLISCHHSTPKYIPYYVRIAAHLQAVFLQSQIDVRQVADEFELTKETNKKLQHLSEQLAKEQPVISNESTLQLLQNLLNAGGIAIIHKGNLFTAGIVPPKEEIQLMTDWILKNIKSEHFSTSRFADDYLPAKAMCNSVAGICYHQLGLLPGNAIFWMRPEIQTTKVWGGDPNKALLLNEENNLITPRKSFAAWSESVKCQSTEWLRPELDAADAISLVIQRQLHLIDLIEEEVKYRSLNEKLQKANDELANMNWISTHDLKEPLRKIQIYASIILEKYSDEIPDIVNANIVRMQSSAAKMQRLIEALVSYASLMYEEAKFEQVDLNSIIKEVVMDLKEDLEEKGVTIDISTLPTVKGINFQLQQLFVNIISNSIKFANQDVPLIIKISSTKTTDNPASTTGEPPKQWFKITFSDNGIGFNNKFKNDIFKVFHRLHTSQYTGSGIGLAVCKKIVESHNGYIIATGETDKGAQFDIYLPV